MLRYTGHPIADVGVATVCAFSEKLDPASLTREDLENIACFLEKVYFSGKLRSYLNSIFPNAAFVNSNILPETIEAYKRDILYGFAHKAGGQVAGLSCSFSKELATHLANRQHIPLLTGEDVLNFFPGGLTGLPISSEFMLAVQAFPLGGRQCMGARALAVHCPDDQNLTYEFAKRFLNDNRRWLLLTEQADGEYESLRAPKTLVIDMLLKTEWARIHRLQDVPERSSPSITLYYLTNSGRSPSVDLFELPSQVVSFIREANTATYHTNWARILKASWERPAAKGKKVQNLEADSPPSAGKSRNFLFDDLFELPQKAARFVRTYFLRRAYRFRRGNNNGIRDLDLVSWKLTELFLEQVMGMNKSRIQAIRSFGDTLATHINEHDAKLFDKLYRATKYEGLRGVLLKALKDGAKRDAALLFNFEMFIAVFAPDHEEPFSDFAISRDLLLIRIIEQLHASGFFSEHAEVLDQLDSDEESSDEE